MAGHSASERPAFLCSLKFHRCHHVRIRNFKQHFIDVRGNIPGRRDAVRGIKAFVHQHLELSHLHADGSAVGQDHPAVQILGQV